MSNRPRSLWVTLLLACVVAGCSMVSSERKANPTADSLTEPGPLLYEVSFGDSESVADWVMEGPGEIAFVDGWMEMHSPGEQGHHVFWCPEDFPESFIARWDAQNLDDEAGLVIVFFAARGVDGQDIFSPELPERDGTFTQYTEGEIKSYHISYYANAAHNPGRGHANLRKNNTFSLLQKGEVGIPTESMQEHEITLVKEGERIRLYIDDRKVIDYTDNAPVVDGVDTGGALGGGKIGFRQMKWTQFRYKNFRVYELPQQ
ncbi:YesU family protein [Marinimicrobium sp. C6131]|uniref:DUF1961 family protein n=1 Tax=Marinimicrobium sp. C6131 TaxID=3022676 RepID=UPI00223E2FE0|nr:DUF1961 family protein [Marinimicrobium sp. C6131]UZJ44963.1 YesU family protein [Marinimicrobium sp. C6131]